MKSNETDLEPGIALENVRVRRHVKVHPSGRTHVAYVDYTMVFPAALPDGSDFLFEVENTSLAFTAENHVEVIDVAGRTVPQADGSVRRFPFCNTKTAESRAWLCDALWNLPEVKRAAVAALDARDAYFADLAAKEAEKAAADVA